MADVVDPGLAGLLNLGGLAGFATLVLLQLRDLKPLFKEFSAAIKEQATVNGDTRVILAQLLERERDRAARIHAERSARNSSAPETIPYREETEPLTAPVIQKGRARTSPGGYSIHRPPSQRSSGEE